MQSNWISQAKDDMEISMKCITFYTLIVLSLVAGLQADRLMDPNETETLIRHLTQNSRKYWMPQGMIQARHMEYYEYDDSIRETTETVYYSDTGFRLETRLEDGLSTAEALDQNSPRQFEQDMQLNRNRIFAWDGQKYVQYFKSADYAIVQSDSPDVSKELCGPATAGIIPWGHGDYSFLILMSQEPTCRIVQTADQELVTFEYISDTISLETRVSFVLDPKQDYTVLSYSIENSHALLRQTYDDYIQAGDRWIPSTVLIERFDKRSGTPQLISYEDWQFEIIDATAPANEMYSIAFKNGTMVELQAGDGMKTFIYNASDRIDIASLLEDKIALMQAPYPEAVNCATAAIQHVAKRYSKDVQLQELAPLVSAETKQTSLLDMKEILEEAGLYCMAVKTDLDTLKQIPNCSMVLYMTLSNHYVILEYIEVEQIWLIDLTDRKFYTKWDVDRFLQEWNSGIALLISDEIITPPLDSQLDYLVPDEISRIYGGDGFGKYSCTDVIQEAETITCPSPIGGFMCHGAYYEFERRYGCIEDENGGTCIGDRMPSYTYYRCLNIPGDEGKCQTPDSTAVKRYIRACD